MENNHVHSFTDTVVPPTCTEKGYTLHRCACGYEHKDTFVPNGSHKFVVFEQTDPTCEVGGLQRLRCTTCGVTGSRPIPPLGHDWGQWTVKNVPTCTEDGSQVHFCTRCGAGEEAPVPAIGHNLVNKQKSKTEKNCFEYFCQNCGQTVVKKSNAKKVVTLITVWTSIVLVLAILAAVFVPMLLPMYHYTVAKSQIKNGKYEKAYYHLIDAENYKDSEKLLQKFEVIVGSQKNYDKDGNLTYESVEEYDEDTNTITYIEYDGDGKIEYKYSDTYDEYGNLIKYVSYNSDGTVSYEGKYEYEYDDDGNVLSYKNDNYEIKYELNKNGDPERAETFEDGKLISYAEYEYHKNGNLAEETRYDKDGNMTRKTEYHKNGNLAEEKEYRENGELSSHYKYNENGDITDYTYYNKDGEKSSETKYKYDKKGHLTGATEYEDGEITGKLKIKCDKKGNVTSVTYYDEDGEETGRITMKYDKHGNQTEYARYDENGNLESKTEFDDREVIFLAAESFD